MNIRLHGESEEIEKAIEKIKKNFTVLSVSEPYKDSGESILYRVYIKVKG